MARYDNDKDRHRTRRRHKATIDPLSWYHAVVPRASFRSHERPNMSVSYERAKRAKRHASDVFGQFGPVNGIGVTKTDSGFAVKVNFEREPEDPTGIPSTIDGVPVQIEVVGKIRAKIAR